MKKLISKHALVAIAAGGMLFSSCGDHDMFNPNYKKNEYAANWETKFGKIDPAQDWSMATTVKATANVAGAGNAVMTVYSKNPGNEGCTVLAKTVLNNGTANISFDVIKGQANVYVVVDTPDGTPINGYYQIEDGVVAIGNVTRATRAAGGETLGRTLTLEPVRHPNAENGERPSMELQFINNVSKTTISGWTLGDWEKIVGKPDGKFVEGASNKTLYKELTNEDVIFTMASDGPVSVKDMYGATDYYDRFGYFYYTGNPTAEELSKLKKYVIMDNASVQNNIYLNGVAVKKCELANIIGFLNESWQQHKRDEIVYGSEYKLVYWGEDGTSEPTYTFPKGTKIGFFIHKVTGNADSDANTIANNEKYLYGGEAKLMFSQKKLNAYYNFYEYSNWQSKYDANNPDENGDWTCVTYRYGNTTLVGFEDGADNDMNDIMWFMDGNFEETEDIPQMGEEPKEESQSWILACEDLGSTDDYDFNDIVLEVRHEITYDSNTHDFISSEIQVRCLAAGGTIPANIYYGDNRVGEAHEMLGGQTNQMINTTSYGKPSDWYTVATGVTEDRNILTIDEIIKNISIRVTQNEGDVYATEIKAPEIGEAPQMIIVPGDWEWPAERKGIETAYPEFTNWSSNASLTDWNRVKVSDKVVKR